MPIKVNPKDFNIAGFEYYGPGEIIFREGTRGDLIYLVMKGQVEIFNVVEGKTVVVDKLGEGSLFGEVSFMDKNPRSASARALTNVTLGVVDRVGLAEGYKKLPPTMQVIFDAMARRLRRLTVVASNLAARPPAVPGPSLPSIKVRFNTRDEFFKSYTVNVGGGVLFVRTEASLDEGAEVEIEFNLPGDKKAIKTSGRVAWRQSGSERGLGVQLTGLDPADKDRLAAYVRRAIVG
ncbi:MAG: TIGR02266 family protein [Thermodesulfobacteriota bacterium]